MPVVISTDERRQWIWVRVTGALTIEDTLAIIRTARAPVDRRMWPLFIDASGATTTMSDADVETAVAEVRVAAGQGPRGHVALVSSDDQLFDRLLLYETLCADAGIRLIRVFRKHADAEKWLEILSAARHF